MYKAAIGDLTEALYVVSGSVLYSVASDKTVTELGPVEGDLRARVDIAANTDSICVIVEPRGYYFDGTIKTGTHTAAGNNATVLTDSAASFVEDALIGYRVANTTDGSAGIIVDNDQTTVTVERLTGGTDNDWDTSDAYRITGFGELVDDDFTSRGAGDVEFLDDFLLFREPNSGRIFGADYGTVTDFNALQYAIADTHPDNLVGLLSIHRLLIAFGERSGELWENTGAAGFPFERVINGTFNEGCLNGATVAEQDNAAYWVADDYTVRRLEGVTPVRVSQHAVEQWLTTVTVASLRAWSYEQDGHFFYGLAANEGTWVMDVTTGEWHERQTYGKSTWLPQEMEQFTGKELVGDSDSNKIGYLDFDTYLDWTDVQRMEWTYQPVFADGQRAFHDRLEIVLETGVADTGDEAPQIMLQYSDDGGVTWESLPDREFGLLGERLTRCIWHNLGSSRQRVYKCAVTDQARVAITNTLLEVRGGRL